ncbi:hypothetical protein [Anabaena sp. UHCC 0451]|uniref:hypothetical protein n=1 Tax=Anabaena sp. UHCC 0451 TaxID=2055235 RepID=UPI002B211F88|nr:hypothetical protein [Anabaena sp. UHCC 0451]MEA5577720.1 hypothetical protein [Anabaena sp. UHCC 0451]
MNTPTKITILSISIILIIVSAKIPSIQPFLSYLLVIVFALGTIILTWKGKQTKEKLEKELKSREDEIRVQIDKFYQQNRPNQETINRLALIDNKCAENNSFKQWEKNKRDYQSLPNFLLSIGLLGTFTGISLNLFFISSNTAGKLNIQEILPNIISSMAIAFISSLVALGCSMFLVKSYPASDLDIEKDNFLISLEHYIDTEHLLRTKGKIDELKESIDNYNNTLKTFLSSLDQNTQKFEAAVTKAANTVNTSTTNFQTIINQSSQTMQTGSTTLNQATKEIESLTQKFNNMTSSLVASAASFNNLTTLSDTLVSNSTQLSTQVQTLIVNNQQNLTTVANTLSTSTTSFKTNVDQVTTSLNNQVNQLQTIANQLNYNTQLMQQINNNLSILLNSSPKNQQSHN